MVRGDIMNTKLDYFTWAQNELLGTPRRGMRRPSLTSKVGFSTPAGKSGGLKRSNEVRSAGTRTMDLPALNLNKIRQNLEQEELLASSSQDKDEHCQCTGTPVSTRGERRNHLLKRSAKESPLFSVLSNDASDHYAASNIRGKTEQQHMHTERPRLIDTREKLLKYSYSNPSHFLSNMTNSNVQNNVTRRFNGDSYTVKTGSLTSRTFNNNEREASESGLSAEDAKARAAKSDSTLQAKKLSLRLVSSLEEALAKVSRPDMETKTFSIQVNREPISAPSSSRINQDTATSKLHSNSTFRDEKDDAGKLPDTILRPQDESGTNCSKELNSSNRSEFVKVKSFKLLFDTNQSSVPIGFGGNPVDNVQTARVHHPVALEPSPRLALTDRSTPRKSALPTTYQKRKKSDAVTFPSLPPGMLATPEAVLKQCASHMTEYEQHEILPYLEVYFIGAQSKKIQTSSTPGACNFGFDDERGDYHVVERDHLAYRYEVLGILGKGSFGQVLKCIDHKCKALRAVKVIRNKKRFHQQALIEVKILEHLRDKAAEESVNHNIVTIHESFYFRGHLCITFELHDISLYDLIKRNNFQGISMVIIRSFAIQILTTLKYLRRLHVIHCDLKPENILLQHCSSSKIKVIDFGSSCFEHEKIYTYIQSRFYRSPEVILGLSYDMMIDVWSFGCILAELCSGCPLFPGENEMEQLSCMMEILGVPPESVLEQATRKKMFFDSNNHPRIVPNSWGKKYWPGTKNFANAIKCNDPVFVNFVECCLRWDKNQRLTPDDLFQHPWIVEIPSPATHRLPLQPSNQDTSKRRSIKTSETPQRSSKQSKQTTPTTSAAVKSHHLKLSNLGKFTYSGGGGGGDLPLPPIGETLTLKSLQEKKKSITEH